MVFARLRSLWRNLTHQDRVERELDDERAARDLFDAAGHAETVQLARRERLQDEEVESSLEQGRGFASHDNSYRMSI